MLDAMPEKQKMHRLAISEEDKLLMPAEIVRGYSQHPAFKDSFNAYTEKFMEKYGIVDVSDLNVKKTETLKRGVEAPEADSAATKKPRWTPSTLSMVQRSLSQCCSRPNWEARTQSSSKCTAKRSVCR